MELTPADGTREQGVSPVELADRLSKKLPIRRSERRLSATFEQRILRNSVAGPPHTALDITHAPTATCRKSHYHMPLGHTGPFMPHGHPGASPPVSRFNSRQSFHRSGVASADSSTHGGSAHTRACGQQHSSAAANRLFRWGGEPRGHARPTTESSTSSQPAHHGNASVPPPGADILTDIVAGAYRPSADIPQPVPFPAPSLSTVAAVPEATGLDAPAIEVVSKTPPTFGEMEA